jgi:putative ABC transport system ATP-binding protein
MSDGLIDLRKVYKIFTNGEVKTRALRGVDLDIGRGEFVSIMGPSGSGKSTLMHIMGFLDRLTKGEYYFDGKNITGYSDEELAFLRRDEVGFVFQFFYLLKNATVFDNVMLPLMYADVPRGERKPMVERAIEQVGLTDRMEHKSNQLSGGERQRVALARAVVNEPSVLFADEPTGNLDTKTGFKILQILRDLHDEGHTIVMVTHEQEAAEFAERIVRMQDGDIESDEANHDRRTDSFRK